MRLPSIGLLVIAGVVVAGVVVAGVHYSSGGAAPSASATPPDELSALGISEPGSSASPAGSPSSALAPTTLDAELALIKPAIADTPGPLDRGTAMLALWASKNLSWPALRGLPSTSAALFRKDPDEERGRMLCIEGTIEEIRAEKNLARRLTLDKATPLVESASSALLAGVTRTPERADAGDGGSGSGQPSLIGTDDPEWAVPGGKVFFATIIEPEKKKTEDPRVRGKALTVEAVAVRSTGTLVDGDSARFCGILTGVVSLPGGGSEGHLIHRAVGMFDLPENTGAPIAARPAAAAAAAPGAAAPAAPATSAP